jgi:hypothetical protein
MRATSDGFFNLINDVNLQALVSNFLDKMEFFF